MQRQLFIFEVGVTHEKNIFSQIQTPRFNCRVFSGIDFSAFTVRNKHIVEAAIASSDKSNGRAF
jgi:hypothetical protein